MSYIVFNHFSVCSGRKTREVDPHRDTGLPGTNQKDPFGLQTWSYEPEKNKINCFDALRPLLSSGLLKFICTDLPETIKNLS